MVKVTLGMKAFISPMPALLIGTLIDGKSNFMTAAWGGIAASEPPAVAVGIRPERYTHKGIRQNLAFSVNIPSTDLAKEVDLCGRESGSVVNKVEECKFKVFYGKLKMAPLIEQCPVNLECQVMHMLNLGSHTLVIGRVEEAHISENCVTDGRPDVFKINPIIFAPSGINYHYCSVGKPIPTSFRFGPPPTRPNSQR